MDDARARAEELFSHFLGLFTLHEPKRDVEKRLEKSIDLSIASLPLATRLIGKPLLKQVALIPDSLEFTRAHGHAVVTFSRKLVLEAELDGAPKHQKVIAGAWADVSHRTSDGAVETRVYSEAGTVTNRYELAGDELIGHVLMESQHLPKPIQYSARLARRPR